MTIVARIFNESNVVMTLSIYEQDQGRHFEWVLVGLPAPSRMRPEHRVGLHRAGWLWVSGRGRSRGVWVTSCVATGLEAARELGLVVQTRLLSCPPSTFTVAIARERSKGDAKS